MAVFGELTDEVSQKSRYAKWRAAYIVKCVKNGDQPLPPETDDLEEEPTPASDHLSPNPSDTGLAGGPNQAGWPASTGFAPEPAPVAPQPAPSVRPPPVAPRTSVFHEQPSPVGAVTAMSEQNSFSLNQFPILRQHV